MVSLELRPSEVTEHADVVLPVAAVAEKAGTFLNWEGRVRLFEAALKPDQMTRGLAPSGRTGAARCWPTPWTSHLGLPDRAHRPRGARPARALGRPARHRARRETGGPAAAPGRRRGRRSPGTGCCSTRAVLQQGDEALAGTRHAARRAAVGRPRRPRRASRTATCCRHRPGRVGRAPAADHRDARPRGLAPAELHRRRRRLRPGRAPRRNSSRIGPASPATEAPEVEPHEPATSPPKTCRCSARDPWWLVVVKAVFCFAFLMLTVLFSIVMGAQGRRLDAAAHRPQPARPLGHAPVARRRHEADAEGRRRRQARGQGGLRPRADRRGHPGLHGDRGDPLRPGRQRGLDLRPPHHDAAHRPADRDALHPGHRLGRHLRHRAGGLVLRLDVSAARRSALLRADDLATRSRWACRFAAVFLYSGSMSTSTIVERAARPLVRRPAAGLLHHLHHHDGRRDQPRALRHAGVRGRPGRRLQHRVLVHQVRDVHARRVRATW